MRFVIDQNNERPVPLAPDRRRWRRPRGLARELRFGKAACRAAADVHLHAGSAPAPEDNPVLVSAASGLD